MTLQRPLLAGYAGACASKALPTSDVIISSQVIHAYTYRYIQIRATCALHTDAYNHDTYIISKLLGEYQMSIMSISLILI